MVNNQLFLFLVYVISGTIICIVFDFFRSLRRSFKTSNIVTYIEDVSFWIIAGTIIILLIKHYSYGELRLYIPIGIITGAIIYYLTLSKYLIKINILAMNMIKRNILFIINHIFKLIGKPIYIFIINLKKMSKNTKIKRN